MSAAWGLAAQHAPSPVPPVGSEVHTAPVGSTSSHLPASTPAGGPAAAAAGAGLEAQLAQVQAHLKVWREIDLTSIKADWDAQAAEIVDAKDRAALSRKNLARQTKEFRDLAPEERVRALGGLIRVFQTEVDALTGRAKFAESAFGSIYKKLGEAPDPAASLTSAETSLVKVSGAGSANKSVQEQLAGVQLENKRLHQELEGFRRDFQDVRNQEVTIRRLEDKLAALEGNSELSLSSAIAEQEAQLRAEHARIEELLSEQLQEQTRRADKCQADAVASQRQLEGVQQELLASRALAEDRTTGILRENEMLRSDCENFRERVLNLEREREELLATGDSAGANGSSREREAAAQVELSLVQKDIEISQLRDALESHKHQSRQAASARDALRAVQQRLEEQISRSAELQERLDAAPTQLQVDELEEQLTMLQSVEFGDEQTQRSRTDSLLADDDSNTDTGSVATSKSTKSDVAMMYREKCKRLETDNAAFRVQVSEALAVRADLETQLADAEEQRDRFQSLVSSLEADLENAQQARAQDDANFDGSFTPPQERRVVGNAGEPASAGSDATMLQIVSGQRDRFKARIVELESERNQLQRLADSNASESETLRSDNLALYEKIRYIQSFSRETKGSGAGAVRRGADDVVQRYQSEYEEQINPFAAFSRNERRRQVEELSPAERVLLRGTEIFLQTKVSRYILVIYALALHVVVFITLYKMAHAGGCDPAIIYAAQQHERLQQTMLNGPGSLQRSGDVPS